MPRQFTCTQCHRKGCWTEKKFENVCFNCRYPNGTVESVIDDIQYILCDYSSRRDYLRCIGQAGSDDFG